MIRNRYKEVKKVYNSLQKDVKNYKPQYKKAKVFTLKDLEDEVEERPASMESFEEHEEELGVNDFVADDVEDDEFEELKMLALADKKKKEEKPEKKEKNTKRKAQNGKRVHFKTDQVKTERKVKKAPKQPAPKKQEKPKPKPVSAKKQQQQKAIDDFITMDQFDQMNYEQIKITESAPVIQEKPKKKKKKEQSDNFLSNFEERQRIREEKLKKKQQKLEEEMKKINCFKPQINQKSRKLDKKRQKQVGGNENRVDNMYKQAKLIQEKKEELKELVDMEKEEQMKDCTFQPKLNKYKGETEGTNVAERNQQWEEKKKEKINKIKEIKKDSELVGCTFTPNINRQGI